MKLENQIVSLELAKKLKELGVKQESHFKWFYNPDKNWHEIGWGQLIHDYDFSAFTVAELAELLPMLMYWGIERHSNDWRAGKLGNDKEMYASGDTMANTLAKMLIYLLENKLI